jgi:hypothetical protein
MNKTGKPQSPQLQPSQSMPSPTEALKNLDTIARQHNGNRDVHAALALSVQVLMQIVAEHAELMNKPKPTDAEQA